MVCGARSNGHAVIQRRARFLLAHPSAGEATCVQSVVKPCSRAAPARCPERLPAGPVHSWVCHALPTGTLWHVACRRKLCPTRALTRRITDSILALDVALKSRHSVRSSADDVGVQCLACEGLPLAPTPV